MLALMPLYYVSKCCVFMKGIVLVEPDNMFMSECREYEKQFQQLKSFMSPSTPYAPFIPADPLRANKTTPSTPSVSKLPKWDQRREDSFKQGLAKLREDIVRKVVKYSL